MLEQTICLDPGNNFSDLTKIPTNFSDLTEIPTIEMLDTVLSTANVSVGAVLVIYSNRETYHWKSLFVNINLR